MSDSRLEIQFAMQENKIKQNNFFKYEFIKTIISKRKKLSIRLQLIIFFQSFNFIIGKTISIFFNLNRIYFLNL